MPMMPHTNSRSISAKPAELRIFTAFSPVRLDCRAHADHGEALKLLIT
jgi:hypothetical protein